MPTMSSDSDADDQAEGEPEPQDFLPPQPWRGEEDHIITYTYYFEQPKVQFGLEFSHDKKAGLFVVSKPDGTVERFRDNTTRYLVLEPDPETGDLQPALKDCQPVYLHLARQHREP
jgi:hypothetical protein